MKYKSAIKIRDGTYDILAKKKKIRKDTVARSIKDVNF